MQSSYNIGWKDSSLLLKEKGIMWKLLNEYNCRIS